jgi:hypothetical protein
MKSAFALLSIVAFLGITQNTYSQELEDTSFGVNHYAGQSLELSQSIILQSKLGDCYLSDNGELIRKDILVNHHFLNTIESKNVQWLKKCVLPFLPGTLAARTKLLSEVSWWSLREGVLELSKNRVFRYSVCHDPDGVDRPHSTTPIYDCGTNIWQVGIAAGQAINYTQAVIDQKLASLLGGPPFRFY